MFCRCCCPTCSLVLHSTAGPTRAWPKRKRRPHPNSTHDAYGIQTTCYLSSRLIKAAPTTFATLTHTGRSTGICKKATQHSPARFRTTTTTHHPPPRTPEPKVLHILERASAGPREGGQRKRLCANRAGGRLTSTLHEPTKEGKKKALLYFAHDS